MVPGHRVRALGPGLQPNTFTYRVSSHIPKARDSITLARVYVEALIWYKLPFAVYTLRLDGRVERYIIFEEVNYAQDRRAHRG